MEGTDAPRRIFVSYATPDVELANALINFLRLACDLREQQVFSTARPGTLPPGTQFTEAIREALDTATMAVLLLTPSYYESRFCLAEAGAVWVQKKAHVPLVVPPVDFHDLEGVQLGEQAIQIGSSSGLDDVRDLVRDEMGYEVSTGTWNAQKEIFLNLWSTRFEGSIALPTAVSASDYGHVAEELETVQRQTADLKEDRDRLQRYSRELAGQNQQLREKLPEAPPPPELEGDETAVLISEAEDAIADASKKMSHLPSIAREALFQYFHDGQPLTVGGYSDLFTTDTARQQVEQGYLAWVEDAPQLVTPRRKHPDVEAAATALQEVRETVFGGSSFESRSEAGGWIRPLLKEKYGITDPTFELRPVWEALDFL